MSMILLQLSLVVQTTRECRLDTKTYCVGWLLVHILSVEETE